MYNMKNIITYNDDILLPKCMYPIKNPHKSSKADDININISNQAPNKKMTELAERQDLLLKKLDVLYDRIKTISLFCKVNSPPVTMNEGNKRGLASPDEIVLVLSPDNLPWFLNILLKDSSHSFNVTWHIHSSVPNERVPKINAFVMKLRNNTQNSRTNLRLIFKSVSADSELRLSSLAVPVVGNVNILRYLAFVYPNIMPYDHNDYYVDSLLDLCHLLERAPEKNKEAIINKLFTQCKDWIYKNEFSIVDVAAYNVVKQWQNRGKHVPTNWFVKYDKMCM